jgi:hypothetical protein
MRIINGKKDKTDRLETIFKVPPKISKTTTSHKDNTKQ